MSAKNELLGLLAEVPPGNPVRPVASEAAELLESGGEWSFHVDRTAALPAIHFFEVYSVRRARLRQRGRLAHYHGLSETIDSFAATGDAIHFVGADSPSYFITVFLSAVDSRVLGCIWSELPTAARRSRHGLRGPI
jgi:hypothetical protein